jgi:thiamine kinase-like enzyme
LTLPYLIFDEDTGVKISKFFDIYTYKSSDFKNKNMRKEALRKLLDLHNSDLVFENNFSPFNVFSEIADISNSIEKEAREVGFKIIKKIKEIGINSEPCHQDLYSGNFVVYHDQTYLIDWEYSSMGDKYFDYADLFWQNEFDLDKSMRQQALNEINIQKKDEIEKFEYFEILSMITWGLWALKRDPKDNDGKNTLLKAINLGTNKKP